MNSDPMPSISRTYGPIHFEDLEPHRFEDLVRQLIYDFRPWQQIEATGRAGSDESFDVRAFEAMPVLDEPDPDGDGEPLRDDASGKVWLIQCKRERRIGPKKLVGYLNDIPEAERSQLYGVILAAACDFSKKARDDFRDTIRSFGIAEAHLWGKAEIEDQLFQPKNDHLLFAYFGISLMTRRRSLKSQVRAKLATKRKLLRHLDENTPVVFRDATDDRFPFLEDDPAKSRHERGRWRVWTYRGCGEYGVEILHYRAFAFISEDGTTWDFSENMNDARQWNHVDPWDGIARGSTSRQEAMDVWDELPEGQRGWYERVACIPYEKVIDIDENPRDHDDLKQVYIDFFDETYGPLVGHRWSQLSRIGYYHGLIPEPDDETRVVKFPRPKRSQS